MRRHAMRDAGIRGRAVQVDGEFGGVQRTHSLREKRRNHAGKRVAHAARGHARIARRIDEVAPAGFGDDAAGAFEHHHGLKALRQRKATPADIARYAIEAGNWKVIQPYLEAMTANA